MKEKLHPLFKIILLSQIVVIITYFLSLFHIPENTPLALLRYLLMLYCSVSLIRYCYKQHNKISILQAFFLLWLLYVILSALPYLTNPYSDHLYLKQFFGHKIFLYSIPIIMIADYDLCFLKQLFKFLFVLTIFYIVIAFPTMEEMGEYSTLFVEGAIILLMTLPYHKKRKQYIIILAVVIAVVIMMLLARRNKVFFFGGGFLLAMFLLIGKSKTNNKIRIIILALILGLAFLFSISNFIEFFDKMGTGMESRDAVIEYFILDFSTTPSDWITGRGIFGQFDAGTFLMTDENTGLRDGIENGYLFLILKGGAIWLLLLTIISIISFFNGYFKSNNILCKGMALIILLYYIDMVGFGIPQITIKYIMVFVAIAGCNSQQLLSLKDNDISKIIGLK